MDSHLFRVVQSPNRRPSAWARLLSRVDPGGERPDPGPGRPAISRARSMGSPRSTIDRPRTSRTDVGFRSVLIALAMSASAGAAGANAADAEAGKHIFQTICP